MSSKSSSPVFSADVSAIVPLYNERENVEPLAADLLREMEALERRFEIILVDDGSTDGSSEVLDDVASVHPEIKVIHFRHNCGQTLAMAAGWYYASGRVIVTLDGDRQNDPADIGPLIEKLEQGYACVSGWRRDRQDTGLRRWVSRVANRWIRWLTGVPVHDLGCTLKAYRADALDPRDLFGEMHRFIPLFVKQGGGRIAEMVVRHHPRVAGESKYGLDRTCRVISDIFLVRLLLKYRTRPSHLFARAAQAMAAAATALFALGAIGQWVTDWSTAVPGFMALLILGTGACLMLGVGWACELVIRNRYAARDELPWQVDRFVNLDRPASQERKTPKPVSAA